MVSFEPSQVFDTALRSEKSECTIQVGLSCMAAAAHGDPPEHSMSNYAVNAVISETGEFKQTRVN